MYATRLEIRKASFNLLPNVDAVHEIVPRRRSGEPPHELDCFSLNSAGLRTGGCHAAEFGAVNRDGKRVFFLRLTVRDQPRDERLLNTENGQAIALCCDDWLGLPFLTFRLFRAVSILVTTTSHASFTSP